MEIFLVIVRAVVLLTALAGALSSVLLGLFMRSRTVDVRQEAEKKRAAEADADSDLADLGFSSNEELEQLHRRLTQTYPFMLAAGLLGLVGGILAMAGRTGSGAVWLLVAGVGPAILHPGSLCGTFPLFLAAFLSLLAWMLRFTIRVPEATLA